MSASGVEVLGSPAWRLDWEELELDVEVSGETSGEEDAPADLGDVKIELDSLDLELLIKQEQEPLGWWEEKSDMLEGYGWQPEPVKYYQPATPALIQEFETVLHNTLTPPGTPPHDHPTYSVLTTPPQQEVGDVVEAACETGGCPSGESELDVLVRLRAQYHLEGAASPASWSSDASPHPPSTEEEGSSSDTASSDGTSTEEDPDWALLTRPPSPSTNNRGGRRSAVSSVEEKKLRKKEQNKNAATRYRMKKKAEQVGILGEEKGLQDHNSSLKEQVTELQREIKYLKSLMRDVCRAKGLMR